MTQHRTSLQELVEILRTALSSEETLLSVGRFQTLVFNSRALTDTTPDQAEILRTLAYDLDYFVHDESARREDPSYYGLDRARSEIREALGALGVP